MGQRQEFDDEQEIWTPEGNPSMISNRRNKELFNSTSGGFIGLIAEGKEGYENILSIEAFKEIEQFQN